MTDIRFGVITKETFKNEIKRMLEERGYMTELNTFNRSGTKYDGLAVHTKEDTLTPVVPVDALYQDYLECTEKALQDGHTFTLTDAVDYLLEEIKQSKMERGIPSEEEIMDIVHDWEKAKSKLVIRVQGLGKDNGYLNDKVYRMVEDLVIVPYIQVSNTKECISTISVTKTMAENWKMSEDEIIEAAKISSAVLRPVEITSLYDIAKKAMMGLLNSWPMRYLIHM